MFKLKYLTAATLLAIAGQAGAATVGVTDGSPSAGNGNGEFILTVFNSDTGVSYSRQLEMFVNDFIPHAKVGVGTVDNTAAGDATPDGGLTKTFATDALFTSTFGSADPASLRWFVVAADSVPTDEQGVPVTQSTPDAIRMLITHGTNDGTGFSTTTAGVGGGAQNYDDFANGLNNYDCGLAAGASCVVTSTADLANGVSFTSATTITTMAPVLLGLDTVGYFYYLTGQSGSTARPVTPTLYANSSGVAGEWHMSLDGTLTWNSAAVSAVPVPAAVWLFGSGLLGLVGVARRKLSA